MDMTTKQVERLYEHTDAQGKRIIEKIFTVFTDGSDEAKALVERAAETMKTRTLTFDQMEMVLDYALTQL